MRSYTHIRCRPSSSGNIPDLPNPCVRAQPRMLGWLRWLTRRPAKATVHATSVPFLEVEEYEAPVWARQLKLIPTHRVGLGMLPTPIHALKLPGLPAGVEVWVKRDDLTGMQMSGNKVRKLEFLMAEAKLQGYDSVITIGGIQSNHCRATAVAAKYLGLDCHLILRTSRHLADKDPGLVGNLLVDRLVGATIHLVTKGEYASVGSAALGAELVAQLRSQGRHPLLIPVGGSNALGTWGYIQAVNEILEHPHGRSMTDIVMACGSGGTTAGLALGSWLSGLKARVHAYGVCDDPTYFYDFIDALLEDLGVPHGVPAARGLLRAVQAKGVGYAESSAEELETVQAVAEATGIILDPVYGGKAMHALLNEIRSEPAAWRGRKVLFIHTGGLLGMYDKLDQLAKLDALYQVQPSPSYTGGSGLTSHPVAQVEMTAVGAAGAHSTQPLKSPGAAVTAVGHGNQSGAARVVRMQLPSSGTAGGAE